MTLGVGGFWSTKAGMSMSDYAATAGECQVRSGAVQPTAAVLSLLEAGK